MFVWETTIEDIQSVVIEMEKRCSVETAEKLLKHLTAHDFEFIEKAATEGNSLEDQTRKAHQAIKLVLEVNKLRRYLN
jgi:Mg2+ and Co2+ transporter CorA